MGSFSIIHWLVVLLIIAFWVAPFWKIFPRAGWPGAMSLLMLVPVVNLVLIWVLAFKRWPGDAANG